MSSQLPLFELTPDGDDETARTLATAHAEARAIAGELPPDIRFGTSSWAFPGWQGLVYSGSRPPTALSREGLREYSQHPLLRTVGIDRTYYAPISIDELRNYASQLPAGFRCCTKAPASVMGPTIGAANNPDFLSAERFIREVLLPFALVFQDHTGPFILEFPPFPRRVRLAPADFAKRLDRFLGRLPREFEYAVELRDVRLLTPAYRDVLAGHKAAHVFNYWSAMPMPAAQAEQVHPEDLPFTVVRLLLRPGTWYEDQRERFRPFNAIVQPDEVMREEVTALSDRALVAGRKVWVLVNNKAEGSSPLTIMELAKRVAARARARHVR